MISHRELLERLSYDPETGQFTWLKGNKNRVGTVAGCQSNSYWQIKILQQHYLAHRLAWFYMTGSWPECEVDHEDTNPVNNRWSNLRECSRPQNAWNQGIRSDNSSGVKGVYFNKRHQKWAARVRVGSERKWLGMFESLEDAASACELTRLECHKEFARG